MKNKCDNGLVRCRIAAGMTQEDAAKATGFTRPSISRWEVRRVQPRADALLTLAKAYGCTVDELLKD